MQFAEIALWLNAARPDVDDLVEAFACPDVHAADPDDYATAYQARGHRALARGDIVVVGLGEDKPDAYLLVRPTDFDGDPDDVDRTLGGRPHGTGDPDSVAVQRPGVRGWRCAEDAPGSGRYQADKTTPRSDLAPLRQRPAGRHHRDHPPLRPRAERALTD